MSTDGQEYMTQQQQISEIKNELYIRGGRINTEDLAKELKMDLNQINLTLSEIVKGTEFQTVEEFVVAHYYLENIAREINQMLKIQGQISVTDLSVQFALPQNFLLHSVMKKYLGKIIQGRQDQSDPTVFYTKEHIRRTKSKIRGALTGLLKKTPVYDILTHFNLTDELFKNLFDQLNDTGVINGHKLCWAKYEPSCFKISQDNRLINFYKLNKYLEYFTLTEYGINDPKEYVKKLLAKEDIIFLKGCVIDSQLKEKLEAAVKECKNYLNVSSFLNIDLYDEDIETFVIPLLKNYASSTILFDQTVFSNEFIESLKQTCLPMMQKNAEAVIMSGKYQQYLEKQLAESEKDKVPGSHEASSTKETLSHLEIINIEDVENAIRAKLENEDLNNFVTPIAQHIQGPLNQSALTIAKDFSDKLFQDAHNRKFTHYSVENKINVLINNIKLYEKGLKLFPSDDQPQFIKYLLKSLGGDVLSEFSKHSANQCNLSIPAGDLSVEQRNKIINDISEEYMKPLRSLNTVLGEHNMERFYQATDVCLSECGMILKKIDKKKERLLVHNHKEKLKSEIENCEEPALVLHLVVLVLFTVVTQNMLHASGRQVPLIILFLKSQLKEEDFDKVQKYHEMIAKYLTASDEEKECIDNKLKEDLPALKSIVMNVKK